MRSGNTAPMTRNYDDNQHAANENLGLQNRWDAADLMATKAFFLPLVVLLRRPLLLRLRRVLARRRHNSLQPHVRGQISVMVKIVHQVDFQRSESARHSRTV